MKKMPKSVMIAAFLNLLVGVGLLLFKIPYGFIPIVLFILFFIPKAWARGLAIGVCSLVVFGSLLWIFIMIAIGETVGLILLHASVALSICLVYLSLLFTLFSDKVRPFYIKQLFVDSKDELGSEGWICPHCNAKNKYSLKCWNCDFSKEEYLKLKKNTRQEKKKIKTDSKTDNKSQKKQDKPLDKIDQYKKKKEESEEVQIDQEEDKSDN